MIKIDKGIPVPQKTKGRPTKYPIRTMGVGDSFFVPAGKNINSVRTTVHSTARAIIGKGCIAIRAVEEGGVKGIRVWRIK